MENNEDSDKMLPANPQLAGCVVWTQIPLLSWLAPCIGHVGVCDSRGVVYDFQGPYYVGKGNMLFGKPIEKWKLPIDSETLDNSIQSAVDEFSHRNYNIICSNCHFFAATVLRNAKYKPKVCGCCVGNWTTCATVKIATALVFKGRTIKWGPKICVWTAFIIIWGVIIFVILLAKGIL